MSVCHVVLQWWLQTHMVRFDADNVVVVDRYVFAGTVKLLHALAHCLTPALFDLERAVFRAVF